MKSDELFEPGEYLDKRGPGFFTVASKPRGRWSETGYPLSLLPAVVAVVDPDIDTYISQATFNQKNRRAVNLDHVGLLFSDLDTYHVSGLRNKTPEAQAVELAAFCRTEGIPVPSLVLFSGRGLQPKWLLTDALDAISLYEWNAAQLALCKLLEPFAADRNARDVSRVLRLEQTVNTKSGEVARVVYTSSGSEDCLARYDFTEIAENLTVRFPEPKPQPKPQQQQIRPVLLARDFTFQRLNWYRLYDLRTLWELRGGVPEGYRETTLFWEINFLLRAQPGKVADLWAEAEAIAAQIDKAAGWYQNSDLSTIYRKAKDLRDGKTVEHNGRQYPPLYTPRNQTLLEIFKITPDEERKLRTIISKDEKVRRRREKRRAEGVKVRTSFGDVKPWETEGISRATWYRQNPLRRNDLSLEGGRDSEPLEVSEEISRAW